MKKIDPSKLVVASALWGLLLTLGSIAIGMIYAFIANVPLLSLILQYTTIPSIPAITLSAILGFGLLYALVSTVVVNLPAQLRKWTQAYSSD